MSSTFPAYRVGGLQVRSRWPHGEGTHLPVLGGRSRNPLLPASTALDHERLSFGSPGDLVGVSQPEFDAAAAQLAVYKGFAERYNPLQFMSGAGPSRQQLEDVWRERLDDALRRYRVAKLESSAALVGSRDAPSVDGQFGFRKAQTAETMALAEYKRVLLIFNDLVLNGKFPPAR